MKRLLFLLLLLLPLGAFGIYGYGSNLPESYELERTTSYDKPIADVWQAISDYNAMPSWLSNIEKTEKRDDQEGLPVWRFFTKDGHYMDIQVVKTEEPALFVSRMVESDMPFGGVWTFALVKKNDTTTQVTIKEEDYIASPFWRVMMQYTKGKNGMAEKFLADLGHKFGQTPEIR